MNEIINIKKSKLSRKPVITYIAKQKLWRIEKTYTYFGKRFRIIIDKGFMFDLSSVPRFFWRIIAPFELSIAAPLIHDFLYRYSGKPPYQNIRPYREFSKKDADLLFRHIMKQEGVSPWRIFLAYRAVKLFGRY